MIEPGRSLVANAGVTAYRVGTVKEIPGIRTYVAVDGGMSDNLRPMLYGSRYEALIADRAAAEPDTLVTVAGMHCESGDVLVRDAMLAAPAVGDVLVTPATGAYGHAMANNYNGVTRPPVIFCRAARPASSSAARPSTTSPRAMSEVAAAGEAVEAGEGSKPVRIGLLGRGTVGAAFAELLVERADAVEAATGRRPELAGVLTRGEGDFAEILERSDLVVELMGGTDPAREYAIAAMRAGKTLRHRQQAAARPARRRALPGRPRERRPAALRGGGRGGDPDRADDPGGLRGDRDREGLRDRQRHHQLHPQRDGLDRGRLRRRARPRPGAGLCGGRPDRRRLRRRRGGEDGDPRAARLPHPGDARRRSPTRGSRRSSPTTSPSPRSSASR